MVVQVDVLRERARELGEAEQGIDDVTAGRGRLIVVEGAAGIGKTSLVTAVRELAAARGLRVLSARASELEGDFPFGVVRQLLEHVVYDATEEERERWLGGAASMARALFDPLGDIAAGSEEEELRFRRRHGLYWLVANLARDTPMLVCVDDAQWADAASLGFLRHLATRLEPLSLLLFVAARPQAEGVSGLVLDPGALVLHPAPLSRIAVAHWIADELSGASEEAFAAACHRATGGNPFLVRELLREVRSEGIAPDAAGVERLHDLSPRGVATAVLVRLGGLPPAAAAFAQAAVVLGEDDLAAVGALASLAPEAAAAAAASLAEAGILERVQPVRFVHPVVRTVLYDDVPAATRALAHASAARQLHAGGAAPHRVAAQLVLAAPVQERWALESLVTAAHEATQGGAPESAERFLSRALPEADSDAERLQLLLALGRAETLAELPGATNRLRAALALAHTPAEQAQATIRLARVLRYGGAGGEAVDRLLDAAARLTDDDAPFRLVIEHELLAASTVSYAARQRLATDMQRWRAQVRRPAQTSFDRLTFAAEAVEAANRGTSVAEVVEFVDAAAPDSLDHGHLGRHVRLLGFYALLLADRNDRGEALLRALFDAATERGGGEMIALAVAQRAFASMRRGHVPAAEADAIEALELAAGLPAPPAFLLTGAGALLWVAAERAEPPHPLTASARDDGDSLFARHLNHGRALQRIAQGDVEPGVDALLAAGEREQAIGWRGPSQFPWRSEAALGLARLGQLDRARPLATEELRLARAFGAPRPLGIALRARALLDEGQDRMRGLEAAVTALEGSASELDLARALTDLGVELRRARRPSEAREPLRRGYELATRCGSPVLVERARHELVAAGGRPRRAALSGGEALTPSELRVAELASQELTNRDIAQALFITEKTVETHLGHAYAKLGLRSRRDLAAALSAAAG